MRQIPLTRGMMSLVDDEDFDLVCGFSWHALKGHLTWYAASDLPEMAGKRQGVLLMHRVILGTVKGVFVDHRNGNGLDCRRGNLRECTKAQNNQNVGPRSDNTSGYKGVSWSKRQGFWIPRVQVEGKRLSLGRFSSAEEAHEAAERARALHHKEFARSSRFVREDV